METAVAFAIGAHGSDAIMSIPAGSLGNTLSALVRGGITGRAAEGSAEKRIRREND